jgi:hypothetical protein
MAKQHRADLAMRPSLLELARAARGGPGRVYAGTAFGWGRENAVGYVPVYAELLAEDVDAVGWLLRVSSLATAAEAAFDDTDPVQMQLFGVRWLLLPATRQPQVPATLVGDRGGQRLWLVTGSGGADGVGYAAVVDGTAPIEADADTLAGVVAEGLADGSISMVRRPLIRWDGASGSPTSLTDRDGAPGSVGVSLVAPEVGRFTFQVTARRAAYVALAASWHPRWQARVDGEHADVVRIAPGTAAVRVAEGTHAVTFEYVPYPWTWVLVLLGVAAIASICLVPRWRNHAPVTSTGRRRDKTRVA